MHDQTMLSVGAGEGVPVRYAQEEIAQARSLERLEIFLTPRDKLRYTVQRLRANLRSSLGSHPLIPVVRLYSPARRPRQAGDLKSVAPLCGVGESEILIPQDTAELCLPLGIKMRHLEAGTYEARLLSTSASGSETVHIERTFTVPQRLETEWLLPAEGVRLAVSSTLRVTVTRLSGYDSVPLYESVPLRITALNGQYRHRYVFGRAGSRALDLISGALSAAILIIPFGVIAWHVRNRVAREHSELAVERGGRFTSRVARYLAPAFYRDPSRWVYRNGALAPGVVWKLETLTPRKRPLAGRASLLLRQLGIDEWPQIALLLSGGWSLFGPRAFPNRDGLLAPDGETVQDSRDIVERYLLDDGVRKPGALSMRVAITPRGSIGVPPWPTAVLYDRYDSLHWSAVHAFRVFARLTLTFIWGEAISEHMGPVEIRIPEIHS